MCQIMLKCQSFVSMKTVSAHSSTCLFLSGKLQSFKDFFLFSLLHCAIHKTKQKKLSSQGRERHLFFSKSYNQQKNSHGSECVSKFEIMCNGAKPSAIYSESIQPLSLLHSGLKREWQPIFQLFVGIFFSKKLFYATFLCGC